MRRFITARRDEYVPPTAGIIAGTSAALSARSDPPALVLVRFCRVRLIQAITPGERLTIESLSRDGIGG